MKNQERPADPAKMLLIDKPYGWTSFRAVKRIRGHFKLKKVGHAGTLDPLATGLLILCTGKMTKEIERFMGLPKVYTGSFELGKSTPSHDLETEVDRITDISALTAEKVASVIAHFQGEIDQTPPVHSAIKVDGKRAYLSARKGEEVQIKSRKVVVSQFEHSFEPPFVRFRIECSKGTYIRSLVRDIGNALQTGATLTELRRIMIGTFDVANALDPENLPEPSSLRDDNT